MTQPLSDFIYDLLAATQPHSRSFIGGGVRNQAEALKEGPPAVSVGGLAASNVIPIRRHRERCKECGGNGGIPYKGRVNSPDPRDWDTCDACEGTGMEGMP